jgi:hypothetical protein
LLNEHPAIFEYFFAQRHLAEEIEIGLVFLA